MPGCDHISLLNYEFGREDNRGFKRAVCRVCGKFLGYKPPDDYRKPVKNFDDEKWQRDRKTQKNLDQGETNDV